MTTEDLSVVSWDGNAINDGTNYTAGFRPGLEWGLPDVNAALVQRTGRWPLVGAVERPGKRLTLQVRVVGSSLRTLRDQLLRWFDPEDEDPKALVIEDGDGGDDRYVEAVCEAFRPRVSRGVVMQDTFIATLAVHGDVRWRSTSEDSQAWSVTGTGDTQVCGNDGTDDAYPRLTIEPTAGLTGGYDYKVFIPIRWRLSSAYNTYPIDICNNGFNTQTLVSGGKMQADGDDLRVWSDGVEIDRWLDGINTTTTKVWCNLDFQTKWEGTIVSAIGSGDTVETIDVNENVSGAPSTGILVINSEIFTYTGKNNSLKRFTGVTRAAKGSSAAAHSASDAIWWCQHDLWILYGNGSASAPTVDDDYAATFELDHSTNTSWVYEEFGEDDGLRPGAWSKAHVAGSSTRFYTANRGTDADPWEEIGIRQYLLPTASGRWSVYNPCGITAANFTNGEKYAEVVSVFDARIQSSSDGSSWADEYDIPDPSSASTWESWSRNETLASGSKYVGLFHLMNDYAQSYYVEAADCTLTLNSSNTPTLSIGSEQGNYELDVTITNNTTGDAIEVVFSMGLNEELEIDTAEKTVTYLEDDSSQFQALTLVGGARRDWLKLQPGNNTLEWTQTGTNGVTVTVEWEERYY